MALACEAIQPGLPQFPTQRGTPRAGRGCCGPALHTGFGGCVAHPHRRGGGSPLKALTLSQPWAALVAVGAKQLETRSWRTHYRGPLAIHAARGFPATARRYCEVEPIRDRLQATGKWPPESLRRGCIVAVCRLVECALIAPSTVPPEPERSFGDYAPGRWAWVLDDVRPLQAPVPARGALGLWEWEGGAKG